MALIFKYTTDQKCHYDWQPLLKDNGISHNPNVSDLCKPNQKQTCTENEKFYETKTYTNKIKKIKEI